MKKKLGVFVFLTTAATFTMHIINRIIQYTATIDNLLKNTEDNYYEWRYGKIHYQKYGSGKPLLLIHDTNSFSSAYEWNKVIKQLSKTNTVYAMDLLGCGLSEKPNLIYTNYLYVQLVTDFIKHIIGEKTDIVVTGSSSSFVLMACANSEDLIDQIIMVNPDSISNFAKIPTKRTKSLRFIINFPIIGTVLYNLLNTKGNIEKTFRSQYYYDPFKVEDTVIKTYYESAHIQNTRSKYLFSSIKGRYTNMNITHCLSAINNSIYVITGSSNIEYKISAEQFKSYIPSIEVITVDKAGYLPQLENPSEFVEQVNILLQIEE